MNYKLIFNTDEYYCAERTYFTQEDVQILAIGNIELRLSKFKEFFFSVSDGSLTIFHKIFFHIDNIEFENTLFEINKPFDIYIYLKNEFGHIHTIIYKDIKHIRNQLDYSIFSSK